MLELNYLREHTDEAIARLAVKNFDASETVHRLLELDIRRRETQKNLDDTLAEANTLAKTIGELYKSGKAAEANELKARTTDLKVNSKALQEEFDIINEAQQSLLVQLPNLPHASVPAGKSAEDNEVVHSEGTLPQLYDGAVPHWELASRYDIIDFVLGNKVTGAGFPFYKGQGARLQRALINFFLDEAIMAGYQEIQPPLLVNEASGYGTGQLPDKDGQMYYCQVDKLYLIPTAEVPVTNIYRDVMLKLVDLPVKMLPIPTVSAVKQALTARMCGGSTACTSSTR